MTMSEGKGIDFLVDFWEEKYLREFVGNGGSKIKFVTGRKGSGKTFFLNLLEKAGKENGYKVVRFSAEDIWLHDFKEVYMEILSQSDLEASLSGCADEIVRQMGYDPDQIPSGQTFMDYLSSMGQGDALTRRAIRSQLKELFLNNPLMDNNFALACSLITGGIIGHPVLEQGNKELLLGWLSGDKTIKLTTLRQLGLSPARITKVNARHMLRSLAEVTRTGGSKGLLVLIDDMEILQDRSGNDTIRYTKMRREDTYESIRQLIDEIDSLKNIMFVYAFDRILLDNENAGLKAYQALWMRIQNEIRGERFNRFTDIADLDQLAYQEYDVPYLQKISASFSKDGTVLDASYLEEMVEKSKLGGIGLPAMIRDEVTRCEETGNYESPVMEGEPMI